MCPICFLPMSWDQRGGNKTAVKGTQWRRVAWEGGDRTGKRRQVRTLEEEKRTRKEKRQDAWTKVNWRENVKTGERMWRFHGSQRNLLMTLPLSQHAPSETASCRWDCLSLPHERTQLTQQFIKQTAQYPHKHCRSLPAPQLKHSKKVKSKQAT